MSFAPGSVCWRTEGTKSAHQTEKCLEIKQRGRQLHTVNESFYYRVTYRVRSGSSR